MYPSNYNRFWDSEILVENRHFFIPPLHSTLPLGEVPVGLAPSRLARKNYTVFQKTRNHGFDDKLK